MSVFGCVGPSLTGRKAPARRASHPSSEGDDVWSVTVEDPVGDQIDGLDRTLEKAHMGLDFAEAMHSIRWFQVPHRKER